ncbi:hypothetical protein [Cysteiniphilum halobium]|uniref:hypothetical protein n=1 Tax=Cysteiniphilum halobium TaxID=2219059 RepID=UPI003F837748
MKTKKRSKSHTSHKSSGSNRNKRNKRNDLFEFSSALDLMLAGHDQVIGSDFIMCKRDTLNVDIGHLNPADLNTYDQAYIDRLIHCQAKECLTIPTDVELQRLSNEYTKQREILSAYHDEVVDIMIDYDTEAAKELGNFDPYIDKVVIRNQAEMNFFYDYITLYRTIKNKRVIIDWRETHPDAVNQNNRQVVTALEQARFAILRLDENLAHGGIRVTDMITQKESLLIDKALNRSRKEGMFFICSLLTMGKYVMTSGGGVPVDPKAAAGKSALSLSQPYLAQLRNAQSAIDENVLQCVRKVYGLCLRGGALSHITIH